MALNYLDKAAWDAGVYRDKGNDDDTQQDTSSEDSGYSASGILSAAKNFLEHPFQGMGTVIAPNYTPRPLDDSVYSDIPGTPVASGQFGELEDESVRDERMKDSADYMAANWPRLYGGFVAADEGLANVVGGIQNAVGGGNGILTNVQRAEEGMQDYRDQWNDTYGDSYFLNPNKFATDAGSVIGSSVPIMAFSGLMPGAAVAGGTRALTSALSRAGLGRLAMSKAGQALIADTVRSIPTSNLADSLSEYGTVVNDMMQNGVSEDEARRRAIPMFFKNMALDTFTVPLELGVMKGGKGIATGLLGRGAEEGIGKSLAKGAARTGMLAGASGLTEGYQEGAQNALENDVQGNRDGGWYNPFTWTKEDWEAARGGFVGGALMGVPGNVAAGFHPEARQAPLSAESREQAQSIKDTLSHGKPKGMSNAAYNAYIELANSGNPDLIKQAASSLESFQESQGNSSSESTDDAATEAYKDYETYDQKQEIENFLNNNTVEQIGGEDNYNWLVGVLRNGTPEEVQKAYNDVIAAEKATAEQEAKNRPARSGGSMSPNTGNAMVNAVIQAANDSGVDPRLALAIAARESGGDDVNAISMPEPHDGIYGIMQAQDETVSELGLDSQYPDWKTDPYQNAMVGMAILKSKIANEDGDVWAGVRDYNGAGEEAEQYRQLVKNNYDNMGDIGSGGNVEAPSEAFYDLSDAMNPQVDGMDPNTMAKMNLLARDFYQKYGHRLLVTSLKRNGDGSSYHDEGHAFDFSDDFLEQNPDARDWLVQQGEKYGLKGLDEFSHPVATTDGGNVHFTDHGGPVPGGTSGAVTGKITSDDGQFGRELDQAAQEAKSDMDRIQAQSDQAMNEIMNDDSAEKTAQEAQEDAENAQKQAEESQQSTQDAVIPDVAQTIRDTSNNIDEINALDGMFTKDGNGNDKFIDTPENRDYIKTNYKDEIDAAVKKAMQKTTAPKIKTQKKEDLPIVDGTSDVGPAARFMKSPHARLGNILADYDRNDPKFKGYMETFRHGTDEQQAQLADQLQQAQEQAKANSTTSNATVTTPSPANPSQQAVQAPKPAAQVNTPTPTQTAPKKAPKAQYEWGMRGYHWSGELNDKGKINIREADMSMYDSDMQFDVAKIQKAIAKAKTEEEARGIIRNIAKNTYGAHVERLRMKIGGNASVEEWRTKHKESPEIQEVYDDLTKGLTNLYEQATGKTLKEQFAEKAPTKAVEAPKEKPTTNNTETPKETPQKEKVEEKKGEVKHEENKGNNVNTKPQQAESKDTESTHAEEGSQSDVQAKQDINDAALSIGGKIFQLIERRKPRRYDKKAIFHYLKSVYITPYEENGSYYIDIDNLEIEKTIKVSKKDYDYAVKYTKDEKWVGSYYQQQENKEIKKAAPKDDVVVTGDEFGKYEGLKELRAKAKAYYKEHLQGTSVHNSILGNVELKDDSIDFTGKGISKAVSTSAKENKLLLIKYLPQLIENANEVASQPNVKDKREAKQYTYLMTHAIVGGKRENVIVTIFTDANGNKYYNHILNDEENKKRPPVYPAQAANKSDGIPAMREPFSTSIIPQKTEKWNKPDELRNQLSDGGKQAYDYALDKLSKGNEKVAQSAKESAFIYARMAERWSEIMHEYGNKTYSPEDYTKSHPIVIDDKAIQIIDKYNQAYRQGKIRGAFDANTGAIHLFDAADQSSFIHESAHMFLSDMEKLAREPNAPAGIVADLQAVKNWAVYKPGQMKGYKGTALEKEFQEYADAIREAKKAGDAVAIKSAEARWIHERFARGFERYIADGKAPNESLKNVFEKFKGWMVSIYHDLKNLGKKPPKEIQDLMARMITPETDTKYSAREAHEQLTRSKEDLKAEIKDVFPNVKEIKDEGDRMTFTMPNGSHIVVDMKNEILLTDKELAQAKKDHHIDDNGNVIVEGYAQLHGKDAYMALSQGSRENTGFHEAYHLAEGAVLTDREKAAITKAIPDAEQRADKYAEWVEARKHGRGTAWGKLFQKIKDFAAKMKKIFTGTETVNNIFRQIETGRVWERNVREQGTKQSNQPLYQAKHIVSTFADKINLNRFVNAVLTHNEKSLIMHLGKVDADEAVAIKEATGYDVSNYEHVWRSNDVRHAQKRHGIDTETASDQIGLSPEEMVDALKVISAPDKIERGSINKEGPSIRYIKADNNGQLTIVEVVRSKRKTLDIKTMWKKRAEKLHGDYALQDTSETALDATSSTTENVAHNTDNVNGEKHYSIRKPKDAADEAQEKAEQVAEDTAVTMKDILADARKILPIYTRSKIHYNSRATYRYDEHGRAGFVPSNYTLGDIGASIALHLDHVAKLKGANVELTNDVLDELEIEQRAAKKYKQEAPKAMTPVEARREGVKEFGRIYFQDPARAKEKYPKYYDIFEKTLDGMPEEKAAVEKILELEAQRAAQNPLLLATAGLSLADDRKKPKTVKERLNTAWARFYRTMVDETDPLRQITKCIEMELGKKLADEKDPHKRAVMCNSVAEGRASMLLFADNKAANLAYLNKIYKGAIRDKVTFEDVLNTLRKVRTEDIKKAAAKDVETYFGMYLVAQRTEEIVKTHKNYVRPEGYSHENCLRIIAEAPEAIRKAAQLYWKYNRNLVNIMEAEGLISEKQAAGLRKYEKYCPMYRDMSEHRTFDDELPTITAGRGFINQSSGIKKLKGGSILAVINPIDSMVSMTTALIARCERNDVAKVMVQSAEDHPGLGRIIVKDPSLFRADASKCAFTVMIAGKKTVYRTTPELYQALQEMSTNSAAFLTNVFGKFTDALRFGATNTPSFMVRNFIRDTLSASVNARYGKFVPIVDSIRGMKALKGDADFRAKFYGQGVPMDTYIRRDIRGAKQYKDKVQKSLKRYPLGIRQLMALSRSLVHKYNDVGEALEQGTRAGAMLNALKAGASDFEAGQEARDVTVNFSRHGSFGKKVNRYVPFFNASIQGTDKVIRTFLENPKRASLATCLYIILPTIILWAINHDDDWYKELDDNTKYTNWAVHIPGTDYHWLIPKPQEVGIGFGSGVEAVLNQMLNEDPHAMKAWARQFAEVVTPGIIMTALRPVLEWRYNYSEWTGRKLVPERLSKLPPEQQYTTATSELAKLMSQFAGKYVGLSPIAIDNFFSGWFGSLGRMSANALNKPIDAIRGSSRPPEPARYWYESPFIGSFARQDGQNSVYVERFYQLAEDMEMDYKRSDSYAKNKGKKGAPIPASLKAAQTCMKTMTKINKDIRSIKDDPKMDPETKRKRIDAAYTKMRTYAKKFVTQFDK